MAGQISVVIADDHALVRQGIRQFLEAAGDIEVAGEAQDGAQALALVEALHPDVALLDIQMPGVGGLEATRRIKQRFPGVRVLVLTAYDDDPYVVALLQAGADGYLLKTAGVDELAAAVRAVQRGETALSPDVMPTVLAHVRSDPAGAEPQPEALSARETEVLRLAARGLTNKAIGLQLGISDRTVQGHLANTYGKLGVGSRTEAVTEALRKKWIVLD